MDAQVGAGEGSGASGREEAGAKKGISGFLSHFPTIGGLPIVWLLLATALIGAVLALAWSRISRRIFPPSDGDLSSPSRRDETSVHTYDT